MHFIKAATAAAAAIALLSSAAPSQACSVCLAGDPLYSQHGASAQEQGQASAYIQVQGWRKESGLLPHEDAGGHEEEAGGHDDEDRGREKNQSQRLDLFLSWTPVDRLTLTLDIPYAFNQIEEIEGNGERETNSLDGLGDIAISATGVLWRNRDVLPSTWVEGRAFLKTPTGRTDRREGGFVDPHLQAGTGSWDFGFGLAVAHRLEWGSLYTSAFYRENTEGDFDGLDYEYGDTVLWNAALAVPIGHALKKPSLEWLTLGAELNFRWAEKDVVEGRRFDDSGGSILYFTPSVRAQLPWSVRERPMALRAAVQLPFTSSWLNGFQDEKEVWSVGLYVPF